MYLDANATSPLRQSVKNGISGYFDTLEVGNPSSVHKPGRLARQELRNAKTALEKLIDTKAKIRTFFTSGGTESCNTLLKGFTDGYAKGHIITSSIEHQAILEPINKIAESGYEVSYVYPERNGVVDIDNFLAELEPDTDIVCLMAANNVTGAVQPVLELTKVLREEKNYKGLIISDATQLLAKSTTKVGELLDAGVDAVALSGHKIGAPAGIGAIVLRADDELCRPFSPLILGGPQEERFRAGSENMLGIVGFGKAAEEIIENGEEEVLRLAAYRERLFNLLSDELEDLHLLTPQDKSLCNTLALRFDGVRADDLVVALDLKGVFISTGSACSSGRQEVSHAFSNMGLKPKFAKESVRISLPFDVKEGDISRAAKIIIDTVKSMRQVTGGVNVHAA